MSRASSALVDTLARPASRTAARTSDSISNCGSSVRPRRRARGHLHAAAARRDQADARPRRSRRRARPPRARPGSPAPPRRRRPAPARTAPPRPARARNACAGRRPGSATTISSIVFRSALGGRHHQAEQVGAGAERVGRLVADHQRHARRARRGRPPCQSSRTMSASMAFILAWNSRQNTPSPMSSIEALALRSTSPPAARTASSDSCAGRSGPGVKPPRCRSCATWPGAPAGRS